jgi:hypothetical protein
LKTSADTLRTHRDRFYLRTACNAVSKSDKLEFAVRDAVGEVTAPSV